ncbi:MAG: sulfite exporter TauE/SafE family protein [Clostridia bacterium]|nr:sulfite exporter TauE/SafE family protein [Clostridia bacterium]
MKLSFFEISRLGIIGVITGLINGLIGIGGGTILIPAMVFLLGEKQHVAHGTSLAIILPTAIVSTYIYQSNNHLDWLLALKIAASGMVGGYLGAKLMQMIPPMRLKQIFGIFMIIAGTRMLF